MISKINTTDIRDLLVEDVVVGEDHRACDEARVRDLAASISAVGLRHPITVRQIGKPGTFRFHWLLVSGRHRLEAMRFLERESIKAVKFNGTKRQAKLWQLSENLHRTDLDGLTFFEQIAEFVRLFEKERRISGQNVRNPRGRPQGGNALAARELPVPGKTEAAKRKLIERARAVAKLDDEVKAAIQKNGFRNRPSRLVAISKEPTVDAQMDKIRELAAHKTKSTRLSLRVVSPSMGSTEGSVHQRREEDAALDALKILWLEASTKARCAFQDWIETQQLDVS